MTIERTKSFTSPDISNCDSKVSVSEITVLSNFSVTAYLMKKNKTIIKKICDHDYYDGNDTDNSENDKNELNNTYDNKDDIYSQLQPKTFIS